MTPLTVLLAALAIIIARAVVVTLRHDHRVRLRLNRWRQWRAQRALQRMEADRG